uniref:Uncharacterized protein n=1 Tax=Ralstonia solanacearum TaxID=305 RepID=A0A0S4TUX6_RALSL|nr:protein of unknown function [Ralstonia solanacearum]
MGRGAECLGSPALECREKNEAPRYMIVNVETRKSLLIRDDDMYELVKKAMLDHGARIVTVGNGF